MSRGSRISFATSWVIAAATLCGCAPPASFPPASLKSGEPDKTLASLEQPESLDALSPGSLGGNVAAVEVEKHSDVKPHDAGFHASSIQPPSLTEATTPGRTVSLRFENATTLVQANGGGAPQPTQQPTPPGVELIPTPPGEPDPATTPAITPQPAMAESVPTQPNPVAPVTPEAAPGFPEVKMADASDAQPKPTDTPPSANLNSNPSGNPTADNNDVREGLGGTGIEGPEDYTTWDVPRVAMVFTGNQHGYIEPCGCTGLERQKGGVARRFTFLDSLKERGWDVVPMDAGNQVRRYGNQAKIKLQQSVVALTKMGYQAVGFGPDDIRLGAGDLLSVAAADSQDDAMYVSANVVVFDPEFVPRTKMISRGGLKIGVTSVVDPEALLAEPEEEIIVGDMAEAARTAAGELNAQSPDYTVLLFFGKEESAEKLVREVEGYDLVVVAGGYGEPTYQARTIQDSATRMIVTGDKGMYAGVIGLFGESEGEQDVSIKYARVPLTHEFKDAPAMRGLMKDYQDQLRDVGLEGLGLSPIPHRSGHSFVGSETCGKCHTSAYEVWEGSAHAEATDSIVTPKEDRGDVARHFDPECISCHVTGWAPQEYHPYSSGYWSLESTPHLTANGCENCHGPGAEHSAAEEEGSDVTDEVRAQLRLAMQLPLEKAREKCMSCHDLDNSPDFHEPDAFEDVYWPEVEHYGLD